MMRAGYYQPDGRVKLTEKASALILSRFARVLFLIFGDTSAVEIRHIVREGHTNRVAKRSVFGMTAKQFWVARLLLGLRL